MKPVKVTCDIDAPVERVFETVADISNFSNAIPDIVNVEFVSDIRRGVGARFKETRVMNGRRATTELEVTEFVENERVRLVSDTGGAIWDSVFTVSPAGAGTRLDLVMEIEPQKLSARVAIPMMLPLMRSTLARDMESVKKFCESKDNA